MIESFESQLQILLKDAEGRRNESKSSALSLLQVDVTKTSLLPIEMWNHKIPAAPRKPSTRNMSFEYVGVLLSEEKIDAEGEDVDSDSYVAAESDFAATAGGLQMRGSQGGGVEFAAVAAGTSSSSAAATAAAGRRRRRHACAKSGIYVAATLLVSQSHATQDSPHAAQAQAL